MRLGTRIGLFVLAAAMLPLAGLAAVASSTTGAWVRGEVVRAQVEQAAALASATGRQLDDLERVLSLHLANFELATSPANARSAFLLTAWRLYPQVTIALLLGPDGVDRAAPVFLRAGEPAWVKGHTPVAPTRVDRLRQELPPQPPPGAAAWGAPFRPDDAPFAVLPLVVASPWGDKLQLAVEVELGSAAGHLDAAATGDREVVLLGADGALLHRAGMAGLVETESFLPLLGAPAAQDIRYTNGDGVEVLAAFSRVPGHALAVGIAQPAITLERAGRDIALRTWYIAATALLISGVVGLLLTRSILEPVERLRDGAAEVGAGRLGHRVEVEGSDELAELAESFNRMGAALVRNRAEIEGKNAEIESFNRELQARVDAQTAELREAQARLVQSGQLAAVGEISAGLAHELNNPLAGLLGLVQLVLDRLPPGTDAQFLRAAEVEALRCRDIVASLVKLTGGEGGGSGARDMVDLDQIIGDVVGWTRQTLESRGLRVEHRRGAVPLRVRANPEALGRALSQLMGSMRTVAAPGARLAIGGRLAERAGAGTEVQVDFELSAVGAGQDDWRAAGFGFWVARQVIEDHAAIFEESAGSGRWRIRFPTNAGASP